MDLDQLNQLIELLEGVDHVLFTSYLRHEGVQQEQVRRLFKTNMDNLQQVFILLQRPEEQERLYKLEGMRRDLEHLKEDCAGLEGQLSQLPLQIEAQRAKNRKQQQAIEHQQAQIARLEHVLQQEAREQQEAKGRIQKEIRSYQKQYGAVCRELEVKGTQLKGLQTQYDRELSEQADAIRRLEARRCRLSQEASMLRAALQREEQQRCGQVELQKGARAQELDGLQRLKEGLQAEVEKSRRLNERYAAEAEAYRGQIVASQERLRMAQAQFEKKTADNQRELQKIQDAIDSLPVVKIITKQEQQETLRAIEKNRRNQLYVELEEKKCATSQIRQHLGEKQQMLADIQRQTVENALQIKNLEAELRAVDVPDRAFLEERIAQLKGEIEQQKAELKAIHSIGYSRDRLRSPMSMNSVTKAFRK